MSGSPPMPRIEAGEYLLDFWSGAGRAGQSPTGDLCPLTSLEIYAHNQLFRELSEPWEFGAILDMSRDYVRALRRGSDPFAKSPMEVAEWT